MASTRSIVVAAPSSGGGTNLTSQLHMQPAPQARYHDGASESQAAFRAVWTAGQEAPQKAKVVGTEALLQRPPQTPEIDRAANGPSSCSSRLSQPAPLRCRMPRPGIQSGQGRRVLWLRRTLLLPAPRLLSTSGLLPAASCLLSAAGALCAATLEHTASAVPQCRQCNDLLRRALCLPYAGPDRSRGHLLVPGQCRRPRVRPGKLSV